MGGEGSGQTRAAVGDLAEGPLPPRAVARELHERETLRRSGIDDVAGEVHGAASVATPRANLIRLGRAP